MSALHKWRTFLYFMCFLKTSHSFQLGNENPTTAQGEERAAAASSVKLLPMQQRAKVKGYENEITGVGNILFNVGGISTASNTNFSQSTEVVIREVGNAIVPLIAVGLSLIPGVGPLIGGLVAGIWGILSPFLGQNEKSPMEKLVEDMDAKFEKMKEAILLAANKTLETTRKERHEALKQLVRKAIQGEDIRNRYICNKYAIVSKHYIQDIKNNKTIDEVRRAEIVSHIHDCDNFLKDTSAGFVYNEFADVLWLPCVMTAMYRLSFLAEITNYGVSLKLDEAMIGMFWAEIKADIKRVFEFAGDGIEMRLNSLIIRDTNGLVFGYGNFKTNFSVYDYEGCTLLGQLLYFDREIYPYGVPKTIIVSDNQTEINVGDYNAMENKGRNHIHLFYNARSTEVCVTLLYCMTGPARILKIPTERVSFRVKYAPNKTHQIRVLYFTPNEGVLHSFRSPVGSDRNVDVHTDNDNLIINIAEGKPNVNNTERFVIKTAYSEMYCLFKCLRDRQFTGELITSYDVPGMSCNEECWPGLHAKKGKLIIEDVAAFYVDKMSVGNIIIKQDVVLSTILGLEIIVLPINP